MPPLRNIRMAPKSRLEAVLAIKGEDGVVGVIQYRVSVISLFAFSISISISSLSLLLLLVLFDITAFGPSTYQRQSSVQSRIEEIRHANPIPSSFIERNTVTSGLEISLCSVFEHLANIDDKSAREGGYVDPGGVALDLQAVGSVDPEKGKDACVFVRSDALDLACVVRSLVVTVILRSVLSLAILAGRLMTLLATLSRRLFPHTTTGLVLSPVLLGFVLGDILGGDWGIPHNLKQSERLPKKLLSKYPSPCPRATAHALKSFLEMPSQHSCHSSTTSLKSGKSTGH